MMCMRDRYGERVGSVRASDLHSGQQARNHRMDLRLVGSAGSDDRFLDQCGRIFTDVDARPRRAHEDNPARLAKFEGGLRILVDEHLFDGRGIRRAFANQRF